MTRGWRDVLPFLAAMWLGELVWLGMAIAGISAIAGQYEWAFQLIKWAGVAYLLYLAWQMWRSTDTAVADSAEALEQTGGVKMFFAGLLVTFGNPKIMVFYVALLPTLFDITQLSIYGWASLSLVTLLIMVTIDLCYVVLASRARVLFTHEDLVKRVNRTCAGMMAAAATLIAARS